MLIRVLLLILSISLNYSFAFKKNTESYIGKEHKETLHDFTENFKQFFNRVKRERQNSICPSACTCRPLGNENKNVRCIGAGKVEVPGEIPGDATLIDLAHNSIRVIGANALSDLPHVKQMDFSFNKIEEIESYAFKHQFRLKWLDLSNNPLANFTLFDLSEARRSLQVLNISNTAITALPRLSNDLGQAMSYLERLEAGNNNLTEVSAGFIPASVRYLDLSCLDTVELSGEGFQNLDMLTELILRGCPSQKGIQYVRAGAFENLNSLKLLDLSSNSLKTIPRRLPKALLYLDLSNNQIRQIKHGKCATEEEILNYYFLAANSEDNVQDDTVGSDLSRLRYLNELNLSNNLISNLCSDDFLMLQQLKVLNLSGCDIQSFHPDTFLYTQSITVLDISNNQIKKFFLSDLPDLQELYCQRNSISEVKGITKISLPSLNKADFSYNPYNCDCQLTDFIEFLYSAYNGRVHVLHLSETSIRYTCNKPPNLRDRSLMSLDMKSEITCGEPPTGVQWPAIAAPISLVSLLLLIVVILVICKKSSKKINCACTCCQRNEEKTTVAPVNTDYDDESNIEIQNNSINDLAILSHELNHSWVMNTFVQKIQQGKLKVTNTKGPDEEDEPQRPLSVEVFTIGKTIRMETLHKCIDGNRKIALIITHEFLKEPSCQYILEVVQNRLSADPKDAVVLIFLDPISRSNIPDSLQKLIAEKTFLQFPHKERERQEFYFWENLNSFVFALPPKLQRPWQAEDDELIISKRHHHRYHEEKLNNGSDTIRSSRRAALGKTDRNNSADPFSFGSIPVDQIPRLNNSYVKKPIPAEVKGIHQDPLLTRTTSRSHKAENPRMKNDVFQEDIDELYSSRYRTYRFDQQQLRNHTIGTHSLLPPNYSDVESVYSDDVNQHFDDRVIRPRERHRSLKPESRHSRSVKSLEEAILHRNDEIDILGNLHGTEIQKEIPFVGAPDDADKNFIVQDHSGMNKDSFNQKKTKGLARLKSLF